MSDDLNWLPAREIARRFAEGELSPVDVLKATLAQLHAVNSGITVPAHKIATVAQGRVTNSDDGQITSDFPKLCQAQESKIFRFRSHPNQSHNSACLTADEGRFAIVTNAR